MVSGKTYTMVENVINIYKQQCNQYLVCSIGKWWDLFGLKNCAKHGSFFRSGICPVCPPFLPFLLVLANFDDEASHTKVMMSPRKQSDATLINKLFILLKINN